MCAILVTPPATDIALLDTARMPLNDELRARLHSIARASIRHGLDFGTRSDLSLENLPPDLRLPGATFVTLHVHDRLRGCIGSLEARRPLALDVHWNAFAAAFEDSRFPPLRSDEFDALTIRISLLQPPEIIAADSEDALVQALRPGQDGLIMKYGSRRATFLPDVWKELPNPRDFVRHLKRKAGLSSSDWPADMQCWRYETETF
jgi:AmmeMemoRadiSam system protein A